MTDSSDTPIQVPPELRNPFAPELPNDPVELLIAIDPVHYARLEQEARAAGNPNIAGYIEERIATCLA